jgi:predicted protein tyrosine phosphatase
MMFAAYRLSCGSSKSTGAALGAALPLHSDSFHLARMKVFSDVRTPNPQLHRLAGWSGIVSP